MRLEAIKFIDPVVIIVDDVFALAGCIKHLLFILPHTHNVPHHQHHNGILMRELCVVAYMHTHMPWKWMD